MKTAPGPQSASAHSKRAILAREAASREIHLHLLPRGFARGKRNSSHARGRKGSRQLYWHVDVVFVQPGKERRVNVDSCSEGATVSEIVTGAIEALRRRNRSMESGYFAGVSEDRIDVHILNEHVVGPAASEVGDVTVPGKAVGEDDLHRYLLLEKMHTLTEVLHNRIIIEFPILYCAVRGSLEAQRLSSAMAGVFEKPDPESESDSEESDDESQTASVSDDEASALVDDENVFDGVKENAVAAEDDNAERPFKRSRVLSTAAIGNPVAEAVGVGEA